MGEAHVLAAELAVARAVAEQAGQVISERWGGPLHVEHKGEVDLVSDVDRMAEALVVSALAAAFPEDAIIAEEGGGRTGSSGRAWHVDPLDGTTNFSHGFPHFCVSVALVDEAGTRVGVVYDPLRRWSFHGARGCGAWFGGRRLRVSPTPTLDEALLATGFPYDRRTNPENNVGRFGHLLRRCQGIRRAGSAALDLAFVAAGWLDGYWEDRLKSWDLAAGVLLVSEAGGQLSDIAGGPARVESGALVATNGRFHRELVQALADAPLVLGGGALPPAPH